MAGKIRTFGWVQDPGEIKHLRKTVEVFYSGSKTHTALIKKLIPKLVLKKDGRDKFIRILKASPIRIKYRDLVGTAFKPRATSRANGIVQVAIPGQKRPFLSDWAADNFVRWAHTLVLIIYLPKDDSFSISELGRAYVEAKEGSNKEREVLTQALLSYPPVMRILNLLADGSHLTKFEIGKQLGFVGEDGFTSLPQNILIQELVTESSAKIRNKMLTDWDGSSDKYARTIAAWLKKMNWIKQQPKRVKVEVGDKQYSYKLSQAYLITQKGLKVRRRGLGVNIKSRIPKNVYWEMLATKGADKNYIRTRRAKILKILQSYRKGLIIKEIKVRLSKQQIKDSVATLESDLQGLMNIGLNIQKKGSKYFLKDTITNLNIPIFKVKEIRKTDIQKLIDECRDRIKLLPQEYLILIPLGFSNKENKLFEMKTVELLTQECGFDGVHLGGADEPDGAVYSESLKENFGVILDTKAYKDGYTIQANQRREMVGYINDNKQRYKQHPNKWWENFPKEIKEFRFLFVSGRFKGKLRQQLKRISNDTKGELGAVINSYNLLLGADRIKLSKGAYMISFKKKLGSLNEIIF